MSISQPAKSKHVQPGWKVTLLAFGIDVALVVLFAALGRSSHAREATILGLWQTAWPFLLGLLVMWISARIAKHPLSPVYSGLSLWIGTVFIGLAVRALTAGVPALPFMIVATLVLGAFLVGWRLVAQLILRLSARRR